MDSWSFLVPLLLFMSYANCFNPQDEALRDIVQALSTGDIDFADVNFALEDLGIEVNETDADDLLFDYSNHIPHHQDLPSHRSKRSLNHDPQIKIPIDFMDLDLVGIENTDSTVIPEGVVFSNSFNLEVDGAQQTMILVDNVFYAIREGALVALTCAKCTLEIPDSDLGWKVTRTEVVITDVNVAYVVQVTAREQVPDTDTYLYAYVVACKVSLTDVDTIESTHISDLQVDRVPDAFDIADSYPRVTMIKLKEQQNEMLAASFHRVTSTGKVRGPHLYHIKSDLTKVDISSSVLSNSELKDGIVDIQLVQVYDKDEFMLVIANTKNVYIFSIDTNAEGFELNLMQKCDIENAVDIVYNSDSIGTFLTIIQSDGNIETRIYDTDGFFVKMQDFAYDVSFDSWSSVETRQSSDLPSQDLVVFKDKTHGIMFVRHVMPGMYEALDSPIGLEDFVTANPNYETIDLGRSLISRSPNTYDYFWLVSVVGTNDRKIHYLKINIKPIPFTINQLNDVTICLEDMEHTMLLDKQIAVDIDEFNTLISLKSSEQAVNGLDLDVSSIEVLGSATINDLIVNINSASSVSYDEIDYTNTASSLSESHLLVNHAELSDSHIFAQTLFGHGPHRPSDRVVGIKTLEVTLDTGVFNTLSTTNLGAKAVDDLVLNLLKLTGDQTIDSKFVFSQVDVSGETQIADTATVETSAEWIIPADFVDLTKSNTLLFNADMDVVEFSAAKSQTFESTLNGINLANILTTGEMDASTLIAPVVISGAKTFTSDITAAITTVNSIGSKTNQDLLDFIDNVVYTNVSQTLTLNSMQFGNIIVTAGATIDQLNDHDVSTSMLNNLVVDMDNMAITINDDTTFNKPIEIEILTTTDLNGVTPEHYLYEGIDQTITAEMSFSSLKIPQLKTAESVNSWDLTDAARVDMEQVLDTKIEFTADVIVGTAISAADGVTIGETDFSEIGRILHEYDAVTVQNSITIKNNDVPVQQVTINGDTVDFTLTGLQDRYLMKDIEQTLPSLAAINQDVAIDNLKVGSTLNNYQLSNLFKVSGDQTVSATNLKFTGSTKFYDNVVINGGDAAAINMVKIKDLKDDIFCDKSEGSNPVESTGVLTISDSDTIVVKSYFDLIVSEDLKVHDGSALKSYGAFNTEVVDLKRTNRFEEKITFLDHLTITGALNSNVDIAGTGAATVNEQNLANFEGTIVKKSDVIDVITPVVVKSLKGVGQIMEGSTLKIMEADIDLYDQYDHYIILDKGSEQTITGKISSVNSFDFDHLKVVPELNDVTYFNNKDLIDYDSTLMKSTTVLGSKELKGTLNVGGDITVSKDASATNFFFSTDLETLKNTAVFISKDQDITRPVTATDITAETVYSHEVNSIELTSMCFKDESCVLKSNADVKFSGASLTFPAEMAVDGMLNSKTVVDRELTLTERSIDAITNLESLTHLVFTTDSESTSSLSHLMDDAVRKSVSDQVLQVTTFSNDVTVANNLDITSNTVNANKAKEVDLASIVADSAFLNKANVFTSDSIQVGDITVGGTLSVAELKNTATINDNILANHLDTILIKSTNENLVQTMVGDVTLTAGLQITGTASISTKLDGVQVADYVMKDTGNPRVIPGLTFEAEVTVDEAVSSENALLKTSIDSFFDTVVYAISDETQSISKNLNFLETVTFDAVTVETLSGIAADNFVLLNSGPQTIMQRFTQSGSSLAQDLNTDTINGLNLKTVEPQILLKDRAETIMTPAKVTFTQDVNLPDNKITIQGFPTIIQNFIGILENFSSELTTYYLKYIVDPLSATIEEIYVANRVGSKRVKYLDMIEYDPTWYSDDFDSENYIIGIDAVQQGEDKYFVKLERGVVGSDCSLADGCVCKDSSISYQASGCSFNQDFTEKAFSFTLDTMTLTATSAYQGSSETCPDMDTGELHIKAVELNEVELNVQMKGVSAESLGSVYGPLTIPGLFQVLDINLIKFGAGHLLVITTGYANGADMGLKVYEMVGTTLTEILNVASSVPIKSLKTLTFSKMVGDLDIEVAHVFVSLDDTVVKVYEWTYDIAASTLLTDGVSLQDIPTPEFSTMEVFKCHSGPNTQKTLYLTVAYETVFNLLKFHVVDILEYNMVDEKYVYSNVILKHKLERATPVEKIQAKKVSDYVSIGMSVDGKIELYDFIVNVGLQKVSEYAVSGNLVDWTWFNERLPKTRSTENLSTLLFIVKEMGGVQSTQTLRLGKLGKLSLPELEFKPDLLGY